LRPLQVRRPDHRVWLRVADPAWSDPLDPSFARVHGGRWNPPGSFDTLYLNGGLRAARGQIARLLAGQPVAMEDLDDAAPFLLVAATLPRRQTAADAVSDPGLTALGLPPAYPRDPAGEPVPHSVCQQIGAAVRRSGLRGVWCRSATSGEGEGDGDGDRRELAWFPARSSSRARPVRSAPFPFGRWRHARTLADLGLPTPRIPSSGDSLAGGGWEN